MLLLVPVVLLLVGYTLGWAVFRMDCGDGLGRWHVNFSLGHSHTALCDEVSAMEIVVRNLV